MKGLTWRISVVIGTILFAIYLLTPSILRYGFGKTVPRIVKPGDPWYYSLLPSETLKLGLDLRGGLHLVLGIDFNEVMRDATMKLKNQMKEMAEQQKLEGLTFEAGTDDIITVGYQNEEQWKKLDAMVGKELNDLLDFVDQSNNQGRFRMTTLYQSEVRKRAIDQSLETLRNRIDEFGIAEPIIQRQGDEKILVQFPGVQETGRLKDIIARTAKLSFQVVRTGPEQPGGDGKGAPDETKLTEWVAEFQKAKNVKPEVGQPISSYVRALNDFLKDRLPKGSELLLKKETNINTKEVTYIPYLLDREPIVTGEDLQDAYYSFDQNNSQPIVNFQLTPMGAGKFEKGTGENVGRFMAIVLDNNVHSAPRIKQRIGGGRAMIEMSSTGRAQQDILNDAKDTSLVLRSGALPARLEFLEERLVGPSLGEDAIKEGSMSLIFGALAVFAFMFLHYRMSGGVAVFALMMNFLFILACLAAFEGTLTLPGLAGMILGLGMSVDSNVLIFEHMRDDLRLGKNLKMTLAEAYSKSSSAIWDANVTAIIAAVVLLGFGYGPIKGFAVTLLMGLVSSIYTAVFVTRVFFDYFIVERNATRISL